MSATTARDTVTVTLTRRAQVENPYGVTLDQAAQLIDLARAAGIDGNTVLLGTIATYEDDGVTLACVALVDDDTA